jgi:hypothetical protein
VASGTYLRSGAIAALGGAALLSTALLLGLGSSDDSPGASKDGSSSGSVHSAALTAPAVLDAGHSNSATAAEEASSPEREVIESAPPAAELPDPGTLKIVVTAPNQQPDFTFDLLAATPARFAHHTGSSPLRLELTAGEWQGALLAAGHEPIELPTFAIREGEETDLGQFVFTTGTSRVSGRVMPPFGQVLACDSKWTVDLFGPFVARCAECVAEPGAQWEPCRSCGGFNDRYRRFVDPNIEFVFAGLLSGQYRLHAYAPGFDPAGVESIFELSRGGMKYIELPLPPPAELELELVYENGQPFTGVIERDGESTRPLIQVHMDRDGRSPLRASFQAPAPATDSERTSISHTFVLSRSTYDLGTSISLSSYFPFSPFEAPQRSDRAREDDDTLTPISAPGGPGEIAARGEPTAIANRFRITKIPSDRYTISVACDSYGSDAIEVDLRLGSTTSVRCVMKADVPPTFETAIVIDVPIDAITVDFSNSESTALQTAVRNAIEEALRKRDG